MDLEDGERAKMMAQDRPKIEDKIDGGNAWKPVDEKRE
jgi:hypothetical protein